MTLYFLRHGRAQDAGGGPDEVRPLTPEGAAALRAGAELWRRLNLRPDVVLTSPLRRAVESATIAGQALGREPVPDERLSPGAGWAEYARAMADHADARRVLFVGHQPDLGSVIAQLTGAASVRMRPGSLACIEFYGTPEPGSGEIAWLIDPDLYEPETDPS